jgi:hypothetical protein
MNERMDAKPLPNFVMFRSVSRREVEVCYTWTGREWNKKPMMAHPDLKKESEQTPTRWLARSLAPLDGCSMRKNDVKSQHCKPANPPHPQPHPRPQTLLEA